MKRFAAVLALFLCPAPLLADTPDQVLERYATNSTCRSGCCRSSALVIGRECTTQEKGDIIAWRISVK